MVAGDQSTNKTTTKKDERENRDSKNTRPRRNCWGVGGVGGGRGMVECFFWRWGGEG